MADAKSCPRLGAGKPMNNKGTMRHKRLENSTAKQYQGTKYGEPRFKAKGNQTPVDNLCGMDLRETYGAPRRETRNMLDPNINYPRRIIGFANGYFRDTTIL